MPPEPGSPEAWMTYARSDLALARSGHVPDVLLETLCLHAQQASEKAIKGVLAFHNIDVPRAHSLDSLIGQLPPNLMSSDMALKTASLSTYAVSYRYPQDELPIETQEYLDAVQTASDIVAWAKQVIAAPGS